MTAGGGGGRSAEARRLAAFPSLAPSGVRPYLPTDPIQRLSITIPQAPDRLAAALADRYRLEGELGAGGMATVYLAEDLRHQRRVAVKVLRAELAAVIGAERFLAEIRTTANLQHPHILALFDSGAADSYLFYVMPYVEGESLRDRLNREKQLPIGDVVRIAKEVASALDYAHRHGVIHRDIKPENILLHDGQALVADFGIALAVSTAGSSSRMTETGMSLGTPHYMSPEQAMGEREVTARSDVYALGAICYEMLVGEPPFTGPTVQAIVAKVLTEEPRPLIPKRHTIPPHIEAVVLTALEKLAADRFASAAEFAAALENQSLARPVAAAAAAGSRRRQALGSPLVIGLAAAVAVLAAALAWLLLRPVPAPQAHRYALSLPPSQTPDVNARFAISADGTRLAYSGPGANGTQIWVKFRDRYEAVPVAGTGNAVSFTFSPDGQSLAFLEGRQVKRIAVAGGAALVLADSAMPGRGVAWLDSDEIVFATTGGRALRMVPAAGGATEDVWSADTSSGTAILPVAVPGERAVLFGLCSGGLCGIRQDLTYLDLERREPRLLAPEVASAAVTTTGRLVYVRRDGAMLAAPFDLGRGEMTGPAGPVLDSVMVVQGVIPLFALSRTGTLVVRPGASTRSERYELIWVDRDGRESAIDSSWQFRNVEFGENVGWALSPDGRRLAIGLATASGDDIWIKQLPRGPLSRLSFDSLAEYRPRWKPDGRSVMYIANTPGTASANLYERSADLTGAARLVHDAERGIYEGVWSRDGRWLAIRTGGTVNQIGGRDILAFRPGVDSAPIPLMTSAEFDESSIALSPDGRWIAYESNETGRQEVYVRPFPDVDRGKRQVSTRGGTAPLWSRNGRELFFVSGDRRMNSITVRGDGEIVLGEPAELFRLADHVYLLPGENYTPHDVAADGRFIMARRIRSTEVAAPLLVAEGWMGE